MIFIATFLTHFGALSLQRRLRKNGIPVKMMPVPRSLSASCGVCVRFDAETPDEARGADDLEAVYQDTDNNYQLVFKEE